MIDEKIGLPGGPVTFRPRARPSRQRAGPHLKQFRPPPIIVPADRAPLAGAFFRRSRCRTASEVSGAKRGRFEPKATRRNLRSNFGLKRR